MCIRDSPMHCTHALHACTARIHYTHALHACTAPMLCTHALHACSTRMPYTHALPACTARTHYTQALDACTARMHCTRVCACVCRVSAMVAPRAHHADISILPSRGGRWTRATRTRACYVRHEMHVRPSCTDLLSVRSPTDRLALQARPAWRNPTSLLYSSETTDKRREHL